MKKVKALFLLLLIGIITAGVEGCTKDDNDPITQAFVEGTLEHFSDMQVYLNQNSDIIQANADFEGGGTLNLVAEGTQTGTYNLGTDASLTVNYGGNLYYSYPQGASGSINVSKIDTKNMWMEMDFSATLVDPVHNNQTIDITEGVIRHKFQF